MFWHRAVERGHGTPHSSIQGAAWETSGTNKSCSTKTAASSRRERQNYCVNLIPTATAWLMGPFSLTCIHFEVSSSVVSTKAAGAHCGPFRHSVARWSGVWTFWLSREKFSRCSRTFARSTPRRTYWNRPSKCQFRRLNLQSLLVKLGLLGPERMTRPARRYSSRKVCWRGSASWVREVQYHDRIRIRRVFWAR